MPFATDRNGMISRQNDTDFITKPTSSIVFPPVISPRIREANSSANTNSKKNVITDIITIKFLPSLYARSFAWYACCGYI